MQTRAAGLLEPTEQQAASFTSIPLTLDRERGWPAQTALLGNLWDADLAR